jgi:hypothetical protein
MVQWPAQASRREDRLARGEPSLLLIQTGAPVPDTDAFLEDWAHTTASPQELEARCAAIAQRAAERRDAESRMTTPALDMDNVLRLGDRSLILAPIEVRLLRAFLESPGFGDFTRRPHTRRVARWRTQEQQPQRPPRSTSKTSRASTSVDPHPAQAWLHARAPEHGDIGRQRGASDRSSRHHPDVRS